MTAALTAFAIGFDASRRNVAEAEAPPCQTRRPISTDLAPDGRFFYTAARGPNPLTGDPHASTGSKLGVLVLELLGDGRTAAVRGLAHITNLDAGGVERADAHGIRVRRLSHFW